MGDVGEFFLNGLFHDVSQVQVA
jgi:hypothetical protein